MENLVEIMKLAEELGKLIKENDAIIKADEAERKYNDDTVLQAKIDEYGAQQTAITETKDQEFRHAISERMEKLYNEITESETYKEFLGAREGVSELMNTVNETINFAVTGKHSCSGNCSSCGGCH